MMNPAAPFALALTVAGGLLFQTDMARAGPLPVVRILATPTAPIAQSVSVPTGYDTIYLSGVIPDLPKPPTPLDDTEAQAESVFSKIGATLKSLGLSEADVVAMTIFMAAPPGSDRMDFAGMMRAYVKFYGSSEQPNKPARSTVQVANLALPGALLEVAVTAVRAPKP